MTALGASPSPTWKQPSYPNVLKLHGKPYRRVMDGFCETYGSTVATNKARIYIYDNVIQTNAKRLQLDADTLTYLSNRIKQDNEWVQQYHTLPLEIDQSEHHNLCVSFEENARVTPTARTEIAALLYKADERTPAQRHVYTFPRSGPTDECQKPRFVPIWSVLHEPFQFPLLICFGEPGGSPGWHGDNRKSRTLSSTGTTVQILQSCRQRLLCEPAFQNISTLAQEHACDSYARQDDIISSHCEKQLPKKGLTTLNAIHQAPSEATAGNLLPVSFHGAPANHKRNKLDAMAVVTRMAKPYLMVTFPAQTLNGRR